MMVQLFKNGRKIAKQYWCALSGAVDGAVFKIANLKVGTDTIIFNLTSAHKCKGWALGLCQIPNRSWCYAYRDERLYKDKDGRYTVREYRDRQTAYWDKVSATTFIGDVLYIVGRSKHAIKYIRFSEAGELRNKADLVKVSQIADMLRPFGIRVYMYSTRKDLMGTVETSDNLTVNGSGFMWHNCFKAVHKRDLAQVKGFICYATKYEAAAAACMKCHACASTKGLTIHEVLRTK